MDPANWQQSVQSAMRFLITLYETNPRETVVQIYMYNNAYCSRDKAKRVEFKASIFTNQKRNYN